MAGEKVLVIEDDEDLAAGMKVRLTAVGYEVARAGDGLSGITVANAFRPDLVLLDIVLPGGDGIVVMERMRALPELSRIPIVVITGVDPERNRRRAEEIGADAFLQKPVDNEELVDAIQDALARARERESMAYADPPEAGSKRVLIVEDDDDLLHALRVRLKSWGYDVSLAADAFTALTRARRDEPDVLLLDIGLPGGDAFTVVERLKTAVDGFDVPVVFLTGRDPEVNRRRAAEIGAAAFLQKPVDNDELQDALRRALEGTSSGA